MNTIITLTKKALRLVFSAKPNTHTAQFFELANITPIHKLHEHQSIKLVHNHTKGKTPLSISALFEDHNPRTLRGSNTAKIRIYKSHTKGQCVYNILSNWNNTTEKIRTSNGKYALKQNLRSDAKSSLTYCKKNKNCATCEIDKNKDYSKHIPTKKTHPAPIANPYK